MPADDQLSNISNGHVHPNPDLATESDYSPPAGTRSRLSASALQRVVSKLSKNCWVQFLRTPAWHLSWSSIWIRSMKAY